MARSVSSLWTIGNPPYLVVCSPGRATAEKTVPTTRAGAVRREHQDIASRILAAMSGRDREVLMRFYLHGQAAEQILADLGVTEMQLRRIKSRAKASFAARAHQRIEPRAVIATGLRSSPDAATRSRLAPR
jgi:hypothetical protein